jgi:ATP-dependent Clp protease ATP-binding subunit ClpA
LFVGIIVEESGPASDLLKQFSVSIERLRANTALKLKKRKLDSAAVSGVDEVRLLLESGYASICELLSQGAIDAILNGKREAQALSQELLEPCHILLGLLSQPSGLAARAAAITGLSIDRLRMGIQRLNGSVASSRQEVVVSVLTKKALAEARVMAAACNSAEIEPDHLLFGILKEHSCLKLFSDLGYDYKDYKETVLLLLKANHPRLFASEATAQSVSGDPTVATIPATSASPPFSRLTDTDIDKLFGRATGSADRLVMRVFSSTAQNAIRLAVDEARRLKRAQVGTDQLLVGILSGEDSVAATALEALGITRGSVRAAIEKEFGVVDSPAAGDLPFSKNAILAFEKAFEAAQNFGSTTIGVDQLLIGILGLQRIIDYGSLSREDCAGVTILRSLGVDLAYLRRLVISKMTPSNSTVVRLGFNADSTPAEAQPLRQSKSITYSDAAIKRFDNFAADALKAVLIAHEVARENRLSVVGTEQILVALVLDTEGKAGAILKTMGVTAERVRAEIDRFIQTGSNISHGGESYTTEAVSVFHLARRGAHFVEGKVGTEHLLLSIITNQRHLASIILGRVGVDVAKLQEIMAEQQTALSEFVEKAAAARSGEAISEPMPVVDYQAALIESGNQSQVLGQEPGLESVYEMLEGLTHEQRCDQNEGDWAALKERFTANLRTVIDMAKTDSCNRNKGIVDAPQLLFALFNLHTNSCANHLKVLNLDRFALRDRLGQILHVTDPRAASAFVGFSALADQVLLRAFQLSVFEGVGWVQTKHLLLALIESDNEKFLPFMEAIGLRPNSIGGGFGSESASQCESNAAPNLSQTALNQDALGVTATAERAMKMAANEAKQMGHNFVGTEQIMLGLIGTGDGVAGQLLLSHGLTLLELRQRVKEIIGEGPCVSGAELPFTPRTKRMLDLALNEAQRLKHDEIGTGHILLGLLREGHGVAARVLTEKGLNLGKLIEVTEAKLLENIAKKSSSYSSGGTSAINEEDYEK